MEFHIDPFLAEELAGVMEDARSFGLQWATFQVENGQIIPENWSAQSKEIAARENVMVAPNTQVVRISEFLPELYQFIDQTPEEMQQAINVRNSHDPFMPLNLQKPNNISTN